MVQLHIEFGVLRGVAVVAVAVPPCWEQVLAQPPPGPKDVGRSNGRIDQRTLQVSGQLGEKVRHKITRAAPVGRGRSLLKGVEKMIVATRDGKVLQCEELSQEQKETALATIFRSYLAQHPEVVQTGAQAAAGASTTPA